MMRVTTFHATRRHDAEGERLLPLAIYKKLFDTFKTNKKES